MINKAIFLDRDGTLIKDRGYICRFKEVEIFSFSVEAIKKLNENRYRVIVITNQSSIARGICSEDQILGIHREITAYFKYRGAIIDRFYYSPYLEDAKIENFRKKHDSRKPAPGMILQAEKDFKINLKKSFMIGDSSRDIIAGKKAGCQTVLVLTGNGKMACQELKRQNLKPDFIAENLLDAVEKISYSTKDKS
ncbi:HAD family hydrolase [bacterium]|nr:HAD family hydrolase [bacterium]